MHKEPREWRGIEGFPNYQVSSDGLVRRITKTGHRSIKSGKKKHGYLQLGLHRAGKPTFFLVHRLVCRAFNGEAPSEKHEVNHVDGNKRNNHYSNLEWSTRKDNLNHAIETGLKKCTYKVVVHNILERKKRTYSSINQVRNEFGISKRVVDKCIRGYPNTIYNQLYKFELLYSEDTTSIKKDGDSIRVKDYDKGTEFTVGSRRLASYLTNVGDDAIKLNLGNNRMVNGFMFKAEDDLSPFIPYPTEAALMSKEDFDKGIKIENKVIVTALHNGSTQVYSSATEAALLLRIPVNGIYKRLQQCSNDPYKGYSFERLDQYGNELKRVE